MRETVVSDGNKKDIKVKMSNKTDSSISSKTRKINNKTNKISNSSDNSLVNVDNFNQKLEDKLRNDKLRKNFGWMNEIYVRTKELLKQDRDNLNTKKKK